MFTLPPANPLTSSTGTCILTAANVAVAFGLGAYSNFLEVLRERPTDFEQDISFGLGKLMGAVCGRHFSADFPLSTALELIGSLAALLAPRKADEIASDMVISLHSAGTSQPDVLKALEHFPEDPEDGLVSCVKRWCVYVCVCVCVCLCARARVWTRSSFVLFDSS